MSLEEIDGEVKETYWQKRRLEQLVKNSGVKKFKKGTCCACEKEVEEIIPIIVELGPKCARRFTERGTKLPFQVFKERFDPLGRCFWCQKRKHNMFSCNIYFCQNCLTRLSNRVDGAREATERDEKKRNKYILNNPNN